jgi:hypothetical protein
MEMVMEETEVFASMEMVAEFLKEFSSLPFTLDGDTHAGVRDEL